LANRAPAFLITTLPWKTCIADSALCLHQEKPVPQRKYLYYFWSFHILLPYDEFRSICFGGAHPMKEQTDRRPRLTTPEVSEMFGVTRATLYRWIKDGKIPEPARDPENGWSIWQQPELDAVARAIKTRKRKE